MFDWERFERFMKKLEKEMFKEFFEFDEVFKESPSLAREPLVDVIDEGENIRVIIELPGVKKEDIDLRVKGNKLVVKAEVKEEKKEENKGRYYSERIYKTFYRTIPLPGEVDEKSAKAEYKNGILEVTLKKKYIETESGEKIKIN